MKNKTLAILGIGTYILSVVSSATDSAGNSAVPVILIIISALASLVFIVMAAIRLWIQAKPLVIAFVVSQIIIFISSVCQVFFFSYGSTTILFLNFVKIVAVISAILVVIKLFKMSNINFKKAIESGHKLYDKNDEVRADKRIELGEKLRKAQEINDFHDEISAIRNKGLKSENFALVTDDGKNKTSELIKQCEKLFPVHLSYDKQTIDEFFLPPPKKTTRQFKENSKPDIETLGKSAKEADPNMHGITLRERIIMEIQYFKETENHLDIKNWTICSGSRDSDGFVPGACFEFDFGGKFCIAWDDPSQPRSHTGIRSIVS
jgi:hypothetical protein